MSHLSYDDLLFLRDAIHSHKREGINQLIELLKEKTISESEYLQKRNEIEERCQKLGERIIAMIEDRKE